MRSFAALFLILFAACQPQTTPAPEAGAPAVADTPLGYHTITPGLIVPDITAAVEFYEEAFAAKRLDLAAGPDGKPVHGEIKIGDSVIMLGSGEGIFKTPGELGGTTGSLLYAVTDVDAVFARAVKAGGKQTMPVADQFWGDRFGMLVDPFGHVWGISTSKVVLTDEQIQSGAGSASEPDEKKAAESVAALWAEGKPATSYKQAGYHDVTPGLSLADASAALDFYVKGLGAVERNRMPMPDGKIMHAEVQLGDSILMVSDETPDGGKSPVTLNGTSVFLYVYGPDADARMTKAEQAGAEVKMKVADMFWGDRVGNVLDPSKHLWSLATHVRDVTPEDIQRAMAEMADRER